MKNAYVLKLNGDLYYADKQPHYQQNFAMKIDDARLYKSVKAGEKQMKHLLNVYKNDKGSMFNFDIDGQQTQQFTPISSGEMIPVIMSITEVK